MLKRNAARSKFISENRELNSINLVVYFAIGLFGRSGDALFNRLVD